MSEQVLDAVNKPDTKTPYPRRKTGKSVSDSLLVKSDVWERDDLSDEERVECLEIIKDGIRERKFAQPAIRAVFGDAEQAQFLDDFLWNHMGDPIVTGREKPKGPFDDDGVSEYNYDYTTRLNGYTDTGILLNIRETRDAWASDKERYAIILGNMATLQVARYRINDIETSRHPRTGDLVQKLIMTTDTFDAIDGKSPFDEAHTAAGLMLLNDSIVARDERHDQQTTLTLSHDAAFKPFGGKERSVGAIDRVVRDRHLLTKLAIAAGVSKDDLAITDVPHSYLNPKAA